MEAINNEQKEIRVDEAVFILRRKITRAGRKISQVSRYLEVNGRVVYSDNMTHEVFLKTLNNPDIFRLVELFSMGEISLVVGDHITIRSQNRKRMIELFERIWIKFRPHKLKFRVKLFKLRANN